MNFRKRQELESLPQHTLLQEVETRWNSTCIMMERLVEQRVAIDAVLRRTEYEDLLLTSTDWSMLETLLLILKPFKVPTILT